jgi:hypothetical protein
VTVLLAALLVARAADARLEAWELLHDHRLIEAYDGTPSVAVGAYASLLAEDLGPEDAPLRGEILLALAEARWAAGDTGGARVALDEAARLDHARSRAGAILERWALAGAAGVTLPLVQRFEAGGVAGWVRAGASADRGELTAARADGNGWLRWSTRVERSPDHLALALASGVVPRRGSLRVYPEVRPARIVVRVLDGGGGSWDLADVSCRVGAWTTVELQAPGGLGRPRILQIVDVSGELGQRGDNVLRIDDLELR